MEKPHAKMRMWVVAALAMGLALRLWFVLEAPRLAGDTLVYGDIAKNLLQRHVYGFTVAGGNPRPTLIRLPGYPLFLAACFAVFGMENYRAVLYVQVLADLATCLLMADLARRMSGRLAGRAALWLGVLCPFTANYVATALTETLSLFCIAAVFYGVGRWRMAGLGWNRWLWMVAAAAGYAVLLRPEQGLLAAAVMPGMGWMAWVDSLPSRSAATEGVRGIGGGEFLRQVSPVLMAAVCVVLPLVPWAMRNERTFHMFQPLAPRYANDPGERVPLGFQHWYRTWAIEFASTETVYWNYDGDDVRIGDMPGRAFDSESEYERVDALLAEYNATDRATAELDNGFEALARERIAYQPIRYYVALPVARLLNMLLRPRTELMEIPLEWWKWSEHRSKTAFAVAYAALSLGYLVVGGTGWWRWRWCRETSPVTLSMMGYVVLRCALLLTLDNSEPRYTLEFFPLLWVWGAGLWRTVKGKSEC